MAEKSHGEQIAKIITNAIKNKINFVLFFTFLLSSPNFYF
jgi:hypothetical protein